MSANEVLILLDYASLLVMTVCSLVIVLHVESYMQKFASYACIMLIFAGVGFLIKAEAGSLSDLLIGQRIAYTFTPHATFAMLLFIFAYCKIEIPTWTKYICLGLDTIVSLMAMTMPYHQLFYKNYWAVEQGGRLILEKEYAFGHTISIGLMLVYALITFAVAVWYTVQNTRKGSRHIWRLVLVVLVPYTAYVLPKIFDTNNDFQAISFAIFVVLVLDMIYRDNLYDVDNILVQYSLKTIEDGVIVLDKNDMFEGANLTAENIYPEIKKLGINTPIVEKIPEFADILNGSIKDYNFEDKIYEIIIRDIESNNQRQGKAIWFEDVTLQRNYTALLLKEQKQLESQVVTLADYSYKDDMTDLRNRRRYEEVISEIRASGITANVLVGLMDLNGLKTTNDTIGHKAGDEIICGGADILREVFEPDGKVFRIGGDEYFVIVTDPKKTAAQYSEELEAAMKRWSGKLVKDISIAYGLVYGGDHPDKNIDELSIMADKEMYKNKDKFYQDMRKN